MPGRVGCQKTSVWSQYTILSVIENTASLAIVPQLDGEREGTALALNIL